jgi:hypothetical protein
MTLQEIKQGLQERYPLFEHCSFKFWGSETDGIFCQEHLAGTREFFGHIYKVDLKTKTLIPVD